MLPNDTGNIKDLVFYRLEVAQADLKAANTLFDIAESHKLKKSVMPATTMIFSSQQGKRPRNN